MDWIVQNARNTDVERQHLNKILSDIKASIVKVEEQARLVVSTNVKDVVGGMLVGEQSGIKVWYDATKGTINFRVPNFTIRLTGDVTGTGTVNALTDVNIVTTLDESIVGVTEAPLDGAAYWRRTGEWEEVPVLIESLSSLPDNGLLVATDTGITTREIEGVAGNIGVVDGDGVAGNPTIDLSDVGDTGLGDLVGVDIDTKGRVIGVRDVDTDDLEEGVSNLYFTDERAQDAVAASLDDTADINFFYDDLTNTITAELTTAVHDSLDLADSAVQSIVAGTNVSVDNTDPQNPIVSATGGGSVTDFTDLGDVPTSYAGEAGKVVVVNVTEDGLEFVAPTGTGTVTSVGITGTDGIEVDSGSPVTASGTIQLGLSATVLGQLTDAASAVQPGDLATVATTGDYNDLSNLPTLGTMAAEDAADYTPTAGLGTAAFDDTTDFATAAQGLLADSAVQSVVAGTNVSVDNTDPQNPVVSASGGGTSGWSVVNSNTTMVANTSYLVDASGGAITMSLPGSLTVGDAFGVRADGGDVLIETGTHIIDGVGSGNDLGLVDGETVYLVASTTTDLEIVSNAAVSDTSVQSVTAGTNVTVDNTDPRNPIVSASGGGGGGSMTLIGTATVAGSAATVLTLSGLSLTGYKSYRLSLNFNNATASAANLSLYFNGDTTAANYGRESVTFSSSTTSAGRGADAIFDALPASEPAVGTADLMVDGDGRMRVVYHGTRDDDNSIVLRLFGMVWTTAATVTSITVSSSVASALSIGDSFSLWGVN